MGGLREGTWNDMILKSKRLESILMFTMAIGTPTLGPQVSEREVYV